jgi:hypothetical protein
VALQKGRISLAALSRLLRCVLQGVCNIKRNIAFTEVHEQRLEPLARAVAPSKTLDMRFFTHEACGRYERGTSVYVAAHGFQEGAA